MIKGMTGFGSVLLANKKLKATVEIRTVNNRYFDVKYYLPHGFGSIEDKIRKIVQKDIQRGSVIVSIRITQSPENTIVIHKSIVKDYLKNIDNVTKEFKLESNLTISDIIKLPGVLEVKETLVRSEAIWIDLEKCLKKALAGVIVMRKREGSSLTKDISSRISCMLLQSNKIGKRLLAILKDKKKKLMDDEFSSFQKSSDINEELSRLKHYIVEMKKILKNSSIVGKKIDFIAQEMQRETNTIGSKVQDSIVSNAVITLKSEIEKIREQAQNIE